MAYVPPHRRQNTAEKALVPDSMASRFEERLNISSRHTPPGRNLFHGWKPVYAKHSISRWWPFGSTTEDPIPASVRLEPFPPRDIDERTGEVPLVLVGGQGPAEEGVEGVENEPWVLITDKILPDLVLTLENLSNELQSCATAFKPSLVARFGKILFHGGSSLDIDVIRQAVYEQSGSRYKLRKSFNTNIPKDFFKYSEDVLSDIGIGFEATKEKYHIKIFDKTLPDSILSCKCILLEGGKELEVYKVEPNPVRHLVFDISCLFKALDLRIMLSNRRMAVDLDDEKRDCITKLVKAAVLDPNVKGGLRWPLGHESIGDRFTVVSVWHTRYRSFRVATMSLKLRTADRFTFKPSSGEESTEVSLKMTGLSMLLEKGETETGYIRRMLEDNIQLIWSHFMSFKHTL